MTSSIRFRIEALAFRALLGLARILPRGALLALGSLLGSLAYWLDGRHRRIALGNLAAAFPERRPAETRRIARACFRHFGRITLDSLFVTRLPAEALARTVRHHGFEHVREAYARGRGVLLYSGHFGHWELVALVQGQMGLPLVLVTRELDNPALERMLLELRARSGNRVVHKHRAIREMSRALRAGEGVAIVIDQDAHEQGVFVPFLGRPASTTPTLALLALRSGAAVVPVFSEPAQDGVYEVTYEPEIPFRATGDLDADVLRLTEECSTILERWVRRRPELWLWMHRRWKTRPGEGTMQAVQDAELRERLESE